MTKLATATIATATVLYAASTSAQCPMHNNGILKGYDRGVVTYTGNPFIRTGGYKATAPAQPDIVDTAVAAGSFDTLVAAVQAAGLADTLKGEGPFTVFAPTDEAFAKLPAGTLDSLLADPEMLAKVLKYHVVPGKLNASDVSSMSVLTTVEGSSLAVADIAIVKTDITTSNGVIHVIDEVLIPQS
jgi:uncharacterized surface protein with fasciclin (FAS1) repeats